MSGTFVASGLSNFLTQEPKYFLSSSAPREHRDPGGLSTEDPVHLTASAPRGKYSRQQWGWHLKEVWPGPEYRMRGDSQGELECGESRNWWTSHSVVKHVSKRGCTGHWPRSVLWAICQVCWGQGFIQGTWQKRFCHALLRKRHTDGEQRPTEGEREALIQRAGVLSAVEFPCNWPVRVMASFPVAVFYAVESKVTALATQAYAAPEWWRIVSDILGSFLETTGYMCGILGLSRKFLRNAVLWH